MVAFETLPSLMMPMGWFALSTLVGFLVYRVWSRREEHPAGFFILIVGAAVISVGLVIWFALDVGHALAQLPTPDPTAPNKNFWERHADLGRVVETEILQLAMLEPKYAVLDETDSGLDIDALKTVAHGVNAMRGPNIGILLITHYQRLLNYIVPDHVHVMVAGRIVRSGRKELALELEERGYDWAREESHEMAVS